MVKTRASKRILCVMLSLIILAATFAGLELTVSAGTNGHTQAEAVAWVNSQVGSFHGNGQCVYFVRDYYAYLGQSMPYGNANQYANGGQYCPSGWSYKSSPQPGDIAVWTSGQYGHVAVVTEIRGSQMVCVESNYANNLNVSANLHSINAYTYIRPDFASPPDPTPVGSEMKSGYARTIPDGDYVIASALGRYYLDIYGTELPAAEGRAIDICQASGLWTNIGAFEIWTLKYNSDGFYSIYQKGTSVSLDVPNATVYGKTKLQTHNANGSTAQKFAISKIDSGNYRIQAKCSGFSLDVYERQAVTGTPVIQDEWHGGSNQQWYFIPYKPSVSSSDKVASTVYNGHEYILYKKLMTWNDARDWCKNQGGNLVTITSSGEQSAVETLMAKASNWIWLGATDEASEGNWKWVTGESFSYSKWAGGQPDNTGNEDYLQMYLDGKWNDIPDYDGRCEYFILEKTHTHTSNSGTITIQPTCTQTGVKTYKCTTCGATVRTEAVASLGHNYTSIVTTQPTCTTEGVRTYKCSRCTSSYTEKVSALGHTEPDSNGNCARCGEHIQNNANPDACPYCGRIHDGFFGRIIGFIHKVLYLIDQLF